MTGMGMKPLSGDDPQRLGVYRLLGQLGSGGMGRIYLARSTADGSLVAVKTLLAEGIVSDTDRRRFAREVTLARRIESAYTARVRDSDPDAERPWMAIEYIPAPALSELVRSAGRLPGSAVRWIAAGTAKALVLLHDAGIVHRDVKPQNILLPLDGPRLIDFGISHANDITRTSLTLGTIAFTSPEQARAEPSTTASDVYSLGATLFHLAVGRPPYPDTVDTIRLLTLVQRGELDLTGLPKELAPLIRPCLASDPDERPEPADVLRQFLEELDRAPTSQRGERWLPPRWTALIEAYEARGRALREGGEGLTADERTRPVPPPDPTRLYTAERAAHEEAARQKEERAARQKEEEERAARRAQEELAARRKQEERARAEWEREAREAREREAREARERKEEENRRRAAARARATAESEKEQRRAREERERKKRAEQARQEQRVRASGQTGAASSSRTSSSSSRTASAPQTGKAAASRPSSAARPAAQSADSSAGCFWGVIAVIALVVFIWKPWDAGGTAGSTSSGTSSGSSSSSSSGSSSGTYTSGGTGSTPTTGTYTSGGLGSAPTRGSSTTGGTTSAPTTSAPPTAVSRTPSAADRAFTSVRTGDCLDAYQNGYGSWSRTAPQQVGCGAADAYLRVLRVTRPGGGCPSGGGRGSWWHTGEDYTFTNLCVERQFRRGQCFLAKSAAGRPGPANLLTAWSCGAGRVPSEFSYIMQVTAVLPASAGTHACPGEPGRYRYSWNVHDGRTMICAKVA
ncbi:serine/threonine-protein kinase [Streptomyces decoyicus]|uniref:serine/threonine-protein kinase n=1 Tax=Streptomyces decoyicus TaxID=249567 RepID=UPI00381400FA